MTPDQFVEADKFIARLVELIGCSELDAFLHWTWMHEPEFFNPEHPETIH